GGEPRLFASLRPQREPPLWDLGAYDRATGGGQLRQERILRRARRVMGVPREEVGFSAAQGHSLSRRQPVHIQRRDSFGQSNQDRQAQPAGGKFSRRDRGGGAGRTHLFVTD